MKGSTIIALAMVVMGGWLGVTPVSAQATKGASKEANQSADKGKEGSSAAVSLLAQAGELVRYARENESPVAMLAAVEILQRVRVQDAADQNKPQAEKTGDPVQAGKKGQAAAPSLDPQTLLAEAKPWAQRDAHLRALIDDAAKRKPASGGTLGVSGGGIKRTSRLSAGYKETWTFTFNAGQLARVWVIGDGDTDLDLYIYDGSDNLITRDADYTDTCLVAFTPKWRGTFRVVVVNRGNVYNRYMLVTN